MQDLLSDPANLVTSWKFRFVRRGRASHRKKDLDDEMPSDWEELVSDVENKDELREWLTTQNCKTTLLPHNQLVRKYLAPGTVMDLYERYKSTQAMLGSHCVSCLTFASSIDHTFIFNCIYIFCI